MTRSRFRWHIERESRGPCGLGLTARKSDLGSAYGEPGRDVLLVIRLTLLVRTWEFVASWKEHE